MTKLHFTSNISELVSYKLDAYIHTKLDNVLKTITKNEVNMAMDSIEYDRVYGKIVDLKGVEDVFFEILDNRDESITNIIDFDIVESHILDPETFDEDDMTDVYDYIHYYVSKYLVLNFFPKSEYLDYPTFVN